MRFQLDARMAALSPDLAAALLRHQETVRAYVDAQGTVEHARKSEAKKRKPPA